MTAISKLQKLMNEDGSKKIRADEEIGRIETDGIGTWERGATGPIFLIRYKKTAATSSGCKEETTRRTLDRHVKMTHKNCKTDPIFP